MARKHLSLVVPTRGTRALTLRCLETVAPLAAQGAELVVVDDGSRDGTVEAVRARFPGAVVLVNAQTRGFGGSANRGLAAAQGELLLLLNSDTEVDPATVPLVVEAFEREPRLGAAGAELRNADGTPQWSAGAAPTRPWLFALASGFPALLGAFPGYRRLRPAGSAQRPRVDWVSGAALAIRRAAWAEAGPFDESYGFYGQDLDFCLRLRDAGWEVRVVPGWIVTHLGGATIAASEGAAGGRHPGLLWTDLLMWGEKRHGAGWARSAARLMRLGAALRLGGRALRAPLVPRSRRTAFAAETDALRRARAALREWSPRASDHGAARAGLPFSGHRSTAMNKLYQHGDLIWYLVMRDLRVRYRRSTLGLLWTMLQPLMMMMVFYVVFSHVFRFELYRYPVYALAGILFWNFFSQSIVASMNSLRGNAGILQKLPVPKAVFPVATVISGIVNLCLALVPLFVILIATGNPLQPALLFLPVSILLAAIFTLGAGLLLSPLAVFFSDVVELVGVVLMLLMYLTPIFYPLAIIPERYRWLVRFNPIRSVLEVFRDPIYYGKIPPLPHLSVTLAIALVALLIGALAFRKSSDRIPFYI